MRDQAQRELEESEAQRIQAAAEFEFLAQLSQLLGVPIPAQDPVPTPLEQGKPLTPAGVRARLRFTQRERQVLTQIQEGSSTRQIARSLNVTEATVRMHVRNVLDKLGARSRLAASTLDSRAGHEQLGAGVARKLAAMGPDYVEDSLILGMAPPGEPTRTSPGPSAPQKPLRPMQLQKWRVTLAAEPASVGAARSWVKATIQAGEIPVDESTAVLLTGELVANAILYETGDTITLVITRAYGQLHVDVHDTSSDLPVLSDTGGLSLVASLSSSWGYYGTQTGKAVYFTLPLTSDSSSSAADLGSALPHGARRPSD